MTIATTAWILHSVVGFTLHVFFDERRTSAERVEHVAWDVKAKIPAREDESQTNGAAKSNAYSGRALAA